MIKGTFARLAILAATVSGAALLHPAAAKADEAACASLKAAGLFKDTTIASAAMVPGDPAKNQPAYCEVKGEISPNPKSHIGVVFRLPENWNGRVLGLGGGGWQGDTSIRNAQPGLNRGYATLQTNAGHDPAGAVIVRRGGDALPPLPGGARGVEPTFIPKDGAPPTGGPPPAQVQAAALNAAFDASWAKDNPEAITDFSWRAVHLTAVIGKEVAAKYYTKPLQLAVFQGCSTGGRMALMEAHRFPDDYSAVIAGAPVFNLAVQTAGLVKGRLFNSAKTGLSDGQVALITKTVLDACDMLDGVKDGLISDPRTCKWDPGAIQCKPGAAASDACLTVDQAGALRRAYAETRGSDGKVVVYGLSRGGESGWSTFVATKPQGGAPGAGGPGGSPMNAWIYGDANYDETRFNPVTDTAKVRSTAFAKDYESDDPDIRPFLAKGGKLILWHGLSDPGPSPYATIAYYEAVKKTAGANAAVRLFAAPGVGHCGGGTGAMSFDILASMDDWIATGKAPEVIAASNPQKGFSRPLCAWPALPFYKGEGDPNVAASFSCRSTAAVRSASN
ncbi:MAG: tannase/feruloyl esterase family alpha/beta hydrolase [Caulobacteraceae bacterium]